jgi:hypothetical protein
VVLCLKLRLEQHFVQGVEVHLQGVEVHLAQCLKEG